jgi:hypothetical protein
MTWISAAVGVGSAVVGIVNKGKANKEAARLQTTRPKLGPSPYLKDQLSLSESELSTGMSGEAKAAYESDLDKSLSASLSAVLKGGGSPNNVGEIFTSDQQGRQRLALMKDNLRLAEIDRVSRARDAAEQERQQEFAVNEDAPWKDTVQANALARQGSENQIWSGVGTAGAGLMRGIEEAKSKSDLSLPTQTGALSSANPNNVPLANTGGGVSSPAGGYASINPNSEQPINQPSLLDTLLANPI